MAHLVQRHPAVWSFTPLAHTRVNFQLGGRARAFTFDVR